VVLKRIITEIPMVEEPILFQDSFSKLPIFVKKNNVLVGMLVPEEDGGSNGMVNWGLKLGGFEEVYLGNSLERAIERGTSDGYNFYVAY